MKKQVIGLFGPVVLIALMIILSSCAPSLRVPVTRPAEVNLKGLKQIAVGEISGKGGQEISDLLTSKLFESGRFEVVDRQNIDRIMREHRLNLSGTVDESTASEIGKLSGADVLIFGNVSKYDYRLNNSRGKPWRDKDGGLHQIFERKGIGTIVTSFRVVGLRTGKILAAKTIKSEFQQTTKADGGWPEEPDQYAVMEATVNDNISKFLKMISPYTEYVTVTFAPNDKKLPELERGVNYAKAGQWEGAIEQFKVATEKNPTHDGAWWNLGLAYEYNYMFDEAIAAFNEANKIKTCEKCIKEIANCKRMAAERRKLEQQGALGADL